MNRQDIYHLVVIALVLSLGYFLGHREGNTSCQPTGTFQPPVLKLAIPPRSWT